MTNELIIKAKAFCYAAHNAVGQKRKYSDEPYWTHPYRVSEIVSSKGFNSEVVAVGSSGNFKRNIIWVNLEMNNYETSSFFLGSFLAFVLTSLLFVILSFGLVIPNAKNNVMREAYDRGHAVQCLGKIGYHWECEE